jgi:multidrug efflux system membrane fusion protein
MRRQTLILLSSFFLFGCEAKKDAATETPAIPVLAVDPIVKDVPIYIESLGSLKPSILIEVRPQISGEIVEVDVKEGDWVAAGASLFKIDSRAHEIKIQEAAARLKSQVVTLDSSKKNKERHQELAKKDLISKSEWDTLQSGLESNQAALEIAEAGVAALKLELEKCWIKSPINGRIGKLDVHPGQHVSSGQIEPLTTIASLDPLIVEFTITEKEFVQFSTEMKEVEIQTLCTNIPCGLARMTFLDNQFDPNTGLLLVRGRVANLDNHLKPGQTIRVKIPIAVISDALLIPQKAVKYNQQGPYVYVIQEDNSVGMRPVILGEEVDNQVVIRQGVEAKDSVITDGHMRLHPGLKVEKKS